MDEEEIEGEIEGNSSPDEGPQEQEKRTRSEVPTKPKSFMKLKALQKPKAPPKSKALSVPASDQTAILSAMTPLQLAAGKERQRRHNDNVEENELCAEATNLKESSIFQPTSASKRKAGVAIGREEKKLVGVDNTESASESDTITKASKMRRRPTAADWVAGYLDITSAVPEDGGLSDERLTALGLDEGYGMKTRWATARYVWNKKGLLYHKYQRLANLKNASRKMRMEPRGSSLLPMEELKSDLIPTQLS